MVLGNTSHSSTNDDSNVRMSRLKTVVETIDTVDSADIGIDESDADANSDSEPTIENDTSWFHFQLMRGSRAPSCATRTRARRSTRRRQLAIQRRRERNMFAQSAVAFMAFVCSTVRAVGSRMRYRRPADDDVVVRRRTAAFGILAGYHDKLSLFNGFKLWVSRTDRDSGCVEDDVSSIGRDYENAKSIVSLVAIDSMGVVSRHRRDMRTPLRALYPKPDYCCSCADSTRYARPSCNGEGVRPQHEIFLEVNPPKCATPNREFDTACAFPEQDSGTQSMLLAFPTQADMPNVDFHLSHFDTCASGCFEFSTDRTIPGISVSPGEGRVKTAAGSVKPSEIRLVRNNHP